MTPKISIITINRNNADGLRKTMESVLHQTSINFEYIVIDGASTDESLEIIRSFKLSNHQAFNYISEPDSGVYNAMNKGILLSKGEYLLFLNSGDFLVNDKVLENICSNRLKADIICGRCNISDHGKVIHTTTPPDFVTFGTLYLTGLAHQSTLIKKTLFLQLGLYDETFKYNADVEFWYRSIIFGEASTQKIDIIISDYNLGGISSMENCTDEFKEEHKRILSHPVLKRIVPDFEKIKDEKSELYILYWVKSKKTLYKILVLFYKIAKRINGRKK
ncbi:MAG TPA: glycosyltransferase family 2 protein [Bacteroidales bacterium]|nr:glycosyltransferase family 2 protein [Bacteroidales bacterium]